MDRGDWLTIASIVIPLLVGLVIFLWRSLYWNEERELLRIYRKAVMLGKSGFATKLRRIYRKVRGISNQSNAVQQSLLAVVKDKDFWREAVLKVRINRAKEKEQFYQILTKHTGSTQIGQIKDVVDSVYDAILDGLESAKNQRWKDRADRWLDEIEAQIEHSLKISHRMVEVNDEQEAILRQGANLSQLEAEQDKLSAALPWALSHDTKSALSIAYELSKILDLQGQRNEALEILRKALNLVLEQAQDAPKELQIKVLNRASHLAIKQAYCDEGEKFAQKMLELSREVKQDANKATAFQRLGKSKYFRCDSEVARELLEESLSIFKNLEDSHGVAWVQFDLGMLEVNQNDFASARGRLEESLARQQNRLDKIGEGTVRVNLAFVLHKQGEREPAYAHMAKAEELLEGNSYFRWYLHFLGRLEIAEGNVSAARDHLRESLKIFRDRRDELGILRSLLGFSWLAAKREQWERAIKILGAEEARRQEMKTNWPEPPDWKTERDFIMRGAREALGEVAFNVALAKGKAMTWEQAIDYSLN